MSAATNTERAVDMRIAARWWASYGIPVFPLNYPIPRGDGTYRCSCGDPCTRDSPAKHPLGALAPNGLHDATTDLDIIDRWWKQQPQANIGLRTGIVFDLLDIDGPDGFAELERLTTEHGEPASIAIVTSGRANNGRHYYVTPPGHKALTGGLKGVPDGIDVKGLGGYAVAPPSQHITGTRYTLEGGRYGEQRGKADFDTLYRDLSKRQPKKKPAPAPRPPHEFVSPAPASSSGGGFSRAVLDRILGQMRDAVSGHRWQTFATECAFDIARGIEGGTLERAEAEAELASAARDAGLDPNEIDRLPGLIDAALSAGITDPIKPKNADASAQPPRPTPAPKQADDSPWQHPQPLAGGDLPEFPTDALGPQLGTFVRNLARDTQTPVDLGGMLLLAVVSATVGKGCRIQITPTWSEQLSLYVAVALPAGEGKSPVFKRLTEPLKVLERDAVKEALPAVVAAQQERRNLEARAKALEAKAAKNAGPEGLEAYAEAQAINMQLAEMDKPVSPRFFVDDVTSEALVQVLAEQGGQVALLSEEGGIFATLAGRYSGTPNLDAVLKAHDGGTIRVDRRTSEPLFVENPALTMGLAVQPSVLRSLADEEALRGRGLIARFLYAVPRSLVGTRDVRLRMTSTSSQPGFVHFEDVVARLSLARCISYKVCCSEDSLSLLTTFSEELETRRHRDTGDLTRVLDWSAKLDGATARIAGLLAMVDPTPTSSECTKAGSEDVGVVLEATADHMQRAIAIARYLIRHAEAALDLMDPSVVDTEPAAQVLRWLRKNGHAEVTVREAHQALRGRHLLKKGEAVQFAFNVLESHGYLRRLPDPNAKPGRPSSPAYAVNPLDPEGEANR